MALAYNDTKDEVNFDGIMKRIKTWLDVTSLSSDGHGKYSTLRIAQHVRAGHHGLALAHINKLLANDAPKDKDTCIRPLSRSDLLEQRSTLYKTLGYSAMAENEAKRCVVECPASFASF
jgi:hypothetical protein